MKTVEFELAGVTYHLCLNGAALFDCYDHFGAEGDLLDHIKGASGESFRATCWMLSKLAERGEEMRRWEGKDPGHFISPKKAEAIMSHQDVLRAQRAIFDAYSLAFSRTEEDDGEEVDLGLLELQKKTEMAHPMSAISKWLRSFLASR